MLIVSTQKAGIVAVHAQKVSMGTGLRAADLLLAAQITTEAVIRSQLAVSTKIPVREEFVTSMCDG